MTDSTYTKLFEQIYKRAEERFFEEIYETTKYDEVFESLLLDHFQEMTERSFLQLCKNLSFENGLALQQQGFKTYRQEIKGTEFLLNKDEAVDENTFIEQIIKQNSLEEEPIDIKHLVVCIAHFLLGREACKTAIEQYEIHKEKNILPFKGQTLSAYLDMIINNQVYEDREAFLGISGLIPEEIQTKKIQYVDKFVQNILKQQN